MVLGPDKDKVFEVRKNSQILRQRRKLDPEMKKWVTSRITLLETWLNISYLNLKHKPIELPGAQPCIGMRI